MTQLIENKPRRHALIATLLHFHPSQGFGGRGFSSDITRDSRSAYRCAGSIAACIRSFDRSSKSRIFNRNIPLLETHLTHAQSMRAPFLIANSSQISNSQISNSHFALPYCAGSAQHDRDVVLGAVAVVAIPELNHLTTSASQGICAPCSQPQCSEQQMMLNIDILHHVVYTCAPDCNWQPWRRRT
jgi:hypothetical protein